MHPVVILIPVAAAIFGPRLWANYVLKQHNREDEDFPGTASELARELLDHHQLQRVKVESTDIGDHYDREAKAVRLSRDKYDRKTLSAVTTAAHEVAHALQDAGDYGPFVARSHLVRLAKITGEVGTVILLAAPMVALISHRAVPPALIATTAFSMLGVGVAAQVVSLPSEFDASFGRALPLLQQRYVGPRQSKEARKILLACSMTYVASSLVSVLNFWPWLGRKPAVPGPAPPLPPAAPPRPV